MWKIFYVFFRGRIYAEALSGLRESEKLKPLILKSGELALKWLMVNKQTEGVLPYRKKTLHPLLEGSGENPIPTCRFCP